MNPVPSVAQWLAVLDSVDPFAARTDMPMIDDSHLEQLTALPDAEARLLACAGDAAAPAARRYAAAEALLHGRLEQWRNDAASRLAVARALSSALQQDRQHNRWGLPGHFTGRLGGQLVSLGDEAVAALQPLLGDNSLLHIVGSEAASLQAKTQWRVADLAAWLIGQAGSGHAPAR